MTNPSSSAAARSAAPSLAAASAAIAQAARLLLPDLERGRRIDASILRTAMEAAFGASDAAGAWDWKTAYDACEAATVLFLRKYGKVLLRKAGSPAAALPMLAKIAGLLPTHTRRSEESQALQQFSTPVPLGLAVSAAAAITAADRVLEPSAGTGLLAILAEIAGGSLVLNELAETRATSARPPLPGRHRNPLRRGADRRSSGCRDHAERRRDEPALLGDGECRSAHGGRSAAPCRFRLGAALPGRPSRRNHRSKLRTGQSGLARRFRPASRARPRRVLRRYRWRRLCEARHHDRHAAHRHRQGTRRRSEGLSGLARNSSGRGETARLGERACPAALAARRARRRFRYRTTGNSPNGPRLRDASVLRSGAPRTGGRGARL